MRSMLDVQHAVLVPVKSFGAAKARLGPVLSPAQRAALARAMATKVVGAAGSAPVYVVCDDVDVAAWAEEAGATVLWRPGRGLNRAVTDGVSILAAEGIEHVVVAHSDLPLVNGLGHLAQPATITLVPDRHDKGTNVIALPTDARFEFGYGQGSFRRHLARAKASGSAVDVVRDPLLVFDLDTPADLAHPLVEEVLRSLLYQATNPVNRP